MWWIGAAALLGAFVLWRLLLARVPEARLEGPVSQWVIPEAWSVGMGTYEGKPIVTRFNKGLRALIGNPAFAKQLGIAVKFNEPDERGFPPAKENPELDEVEAKIVRRFGGTGNETLLAGAVTTGGMREFVLYTSNAEAASKIAQGIVDETRHHTVQFVVNDDAAWNVYQQLAAR